MAGPSHSLLRMASLWEGAIVCVYDVPLGEMFSWGDGGIVVPDGIDAGDVPFMPTQGGWALDPKGVSGGTLHLRGRDQSAADLEQGGPHPSLLAGDHAILEYGPHYRLFVQHVRRPIAPRARRLDPILALSLVLAALLHVGALMVFAKSAAVTHAPVGQDENAAALRFYNVRALPEPTASITLPPPAELPDLTRALADVPSTSNKIEAVVRKDEFRSVFVPINAVQLPRPLVEYQGLTQDEVNRAISSQRKALTACLEGSVSKGTLTLRWDVDPTGVVTSISPVSSTLTDPKAETCIIQHVKTTRFPARKAPTSVTSYPFKLGG